MEQSMHEICPNYIGQIIGYISEASSSPIVIYLWTMLGQRGIMVDKMHTSGYTRDTQGRIIPECTKKTA